jgi:hypothetical protein
LRALSLFTVVLTLLTIKGEEKRTTGRIGRQDALRTGERESETEYRRKANVHFALAFALLGRARRMAKMRLEAREKGKVWLWTWFLTLVSVSCAPCNPRSAGTSRPAYLLGV